MARYDWDRIEIDYRTGKFTLRELSAKHGPSNPVIARRAKAEGWTRDLSDLIKQKTKAALREAKVAEGVAEGSTKVADGVAEVVATNRAVIEGHREGLQRLKRVADKLAGELEAASGAASKVDREKLASFAEEAGLDTLEVRAILEAASIGSRAATADRLASIYAKVIPLERKAHDLDEASAADDGFEASKRRADELRAEREQSA